MMDLPDEPVFVQTADHVVMQRPQTVKYRFEVVVYKMS